jgi:hypothetical protein
MFVNSFTCTGCSERQQILDPKNQTEHVGCGSRVATENFRKNKPPPFSDSLSNIRIFLIGDNNVHIQHCENPPILRQ